MAASVADGLRLLPNGHQRRRCVSLGLGRSNGVRRRSGHGNSVTPNDLRSCSPMSCKMSRSTRSRCIQRNRTCSPSRAILRSNRSVPRQLAIRASGSDVRPTVTAVRRSASKSCSSSRNSGLRFLRRSPPARRRSRVLSERSGLSDRPSAPSAISSSRMRTTSLTSRRRRTPILKDSSAKSSRESISAPMSRLRGQQTR